MPKFFRFWRTKMLEVRVDWAHLKYLPACLKALANPS
jgi:hypothetical protein